MADDEDDAGLALNEDKAEERKDHFEEEEEEEIAKMKAIEQKVLLGGGGKRFSMAGTVARVKKPRYKPKVKKVAVSSIRKPKFRDRSFAK